MIVLEVQKLSKSFGGLRILNNLSFSLKAKERVALIGPNGAGKTTLLNILSGLLPTEAGRVCFLNKDISEMRTDRRVLLGIARSFQIESIFLNLSLLTNLLLAIQGTKLIRFQMLRSFNAYPDLLAEARRLLESVNLWEKRDALISTLSHGERRQVEILLALASKPKLLMLDEPSAGLSGGEMDNIIKILLNLAGDTTILFCAHDMNMVFTLADRVIVLYYGKIIADGTPKEIQSDPRVKEIYLGSTEENA